MTTTLERELKKSEPPQVEAGLRGQLKKSQLPYMMGDLFTPEAGNRAWWRNVDDVVIIYLTPAASAAVWLPSEFSLPRLIGGEVAPIWLTFVRYGEGGTLAPYNEAYVTIPCLWKSQFYG